MCALGSPSLTGEPGPPSHSTFLGRLLYSQLASGHKLEFLGLEFFVEMPMGTSLVSCGPTAVTSLGTILTPWLGKLEKPLQEEDQSHILVG